MSNYIKSPDGGFMLDTDVFAITYDELGRPVVTLNEAVAGFIKNPLGITSAKANDSVIVATVDDEGNPTSYGVASA